MNEASSFLNERSSSFRYLEKEPWQEKAPWPGLGPRSLHCLCPWPGCLLVNFSSGVKLLRRQNVISRTLAPLAHQSSSSHQVGHSVTASPCVIIIIVIADPNTRRLTMGDDDKQAEIDRKKAEVRARLEAQAAGKKAKKGFMTPERKKKLRVCINNKRRLKDFSQNVHVYFSFF